MGTRSCYLALWNAAVKSCMEYDAEAFKENLDWFRYLPAPGQISDEEFYLEYCFVVLHPGVSTVVAHSVWDRIRPILDQPLPRIVRNEKRVRTQLLRMYRNERKVGYMLDTARYLVANPGVGRRLERMGREQALKYLQTLPGIGKVTRYHLARNIGFDVVKPDRHLTRLAEVLGTTPNELCCVVAEETGERVGVVDYVFYQWCAWAGFDEVGEVARAICAAS